MESVTAQKIEPEPPALELQAERECPACGTAARRATARFCATCGRTLDETYLPSDALRSSYYLQQERLIKQRQQRAAATLPARVPVEPISRVRQENSAAATALAFVTYSLVPYLGILFCPGAIVMGGIAFFNCQRAPLRSGRRAAYMSIALGLVILCVQIFLWWLLYKVPQWARP